MDEQAFSIDVTRHQLEQLKDIYKALIKISHVIEENRLLLEKSETSLSIAATACGITTPRKWECTRIILLK